jgi:hypothetical protein
MFGEKITAAIKIHVTLATSKIGIILTFTKNYLSLSIISVEENCNNIYNLSVLYTRLPN